MKITVEYLNNKYIVESGDDPDAEGMIYIFRSIMGMMQFHPQTIEETLPLE